MSSSGAWTNPGVYASVEDSSALRRMASLRQFNVSSLDDFNEMLSSLPLPTALSAILVDQLACSRARVLLLNAFSTFSQLVMGRIGLSHPRSLGWVRDLSQQQQRQLGVTVSFWRREDPRRVGSLV